MNEFGAGLTQRAFSREVGGAEQQLYVLAMAAVVVGVDILFFKLRFWGRLLVNVGIVMVFVAFYLRFLNHP